MSEIQFVDGMVISRNQNAPEYVICKIWIKREEFAKFMRDHPGDLNIEVKQSKGGKYYAAVDNWKPGEQTQRTEQIKPRDPVAEMDSDIPF